MKLQVEYKVMMKFLNESSVYQEMIKSRVLYLAGSTARESMLVGDLDLVYIRDEDTDNLMSKLLDEWKLSKIRGDILHGKLGSYHLPISDECTTQVDMKVSTRDQLPYMLLHYTGNQYFNIALRYIAKTKGMKLNEYGLWNSSGEYLPSRSQLQVFEHLGISEYIHPEFRSVNSVNDAINLLNEASKVDTVVDTAS